MKKIHFAWDFDGTVVESKRADGSIWYPEIGPEIVSFIPDNDRDSFGDWGWNYFTGTSILRWVKDRGHDIILSTARRYGDERNSLQMAIDFFEEKKVLDVFSAINENHPERIGRWGDTRKLTGDVIVDDACILWGRHDVDLYVVASMILKLESE